MRNKILIFAFSWLPYLLFAQDKPQEELKKVNTDLEMGNAFQFEKAAVKFLKVISDSRCPRQVTCIWPGEAKVLLGITFNDEYFEKEVVLSGSGAELSFGENLQMLVSHLRPYPETAKAIAPEEYSLRFAATFPNK